MSDSASSEWDTDPDLRELRDGFLASFPERIRVLGEAVSAKEVQHVAHKVAGVAGSYGFSLLTELGLAIDRAMDTPEGREMGPDRVAGVRSALSAALVLVSSTRSDVPKEAVERVVALLAGATEQ